MMLKLKRFKNKLSNHMELISFILICISVLAIYLLDLYGILTFNLGTAELSTLGTILQSLSSIFAIVFGISLVAIQLCSENLSHRLIDLYVKNIYFIICATLNMSAILFDYFLITNINLKPVIHMGILLSLAAILSLITFFIYTINFLRPVRLVHKLLKNIKIKNILTQDYTEINLYRNKLQPIEDIASNCVKNGDYATAKDIIDLINNQMYAILELVNKKSLETNDELNTVIIYMSQPFAKLLENVAISSNKRDAMEITKYVVENVGNYVEKFPDARFISAFLIYEDTIDRIHSQARHRFSAEEYKIDFARLEITIADARVSFSRFVM